jgi:hypothetical protein
MPRLAVTCKLGLECFVKLEPLFSASIKAGAMVYGKACIEEYDPEEVAQVRVKD